VDLFKHISSLSENQGKTKTFHQFVFDFNILLGATAPLNYIQGIRRVLDIETTFEGSLSTIPKSSSSLNNNHHYIQHQLPFAIHVCTFFRLIILVLFFAELGLEFDLDDTFIGE
jgi:hypothetical protein